MKNINVLNEINILKDFVILGVDFQLLDFSEKNLEENLDKNLNIYCNFYETLSQRGNKKFNLPITTFIDISLDRLLFNLEKERIIKRYIKSLNKKEMMTMAVFNKANQGCFCLPTFKNSFFTLGHNKVLIVNLEEVKKVKDFLFNLSLIYSKKQ